AMGEILRGHGAREVYVVPNWEAETPDEEPGAPDEMDEVVRAARSRYRYLVLYTGNYGWGHDLSALAEYLRARPAPRGFFFLVVGGGEKWRELERWNQEGVAGLAVRPYVPKARAARLIGQADFGLVALERSCVGLMSPSKIHGYLVRGKPLLYLGAAGSNV